MGSAAATKNVSFAVEALPNVCRIRWRLHLGEPLRTPKFLGSALRGLFGHGLKSTACVTRLKDCRGCPLVDSCVYVRLFESMASASGDARVPYVLAAPVTNGSHLSAGALVTFEMTLLSHHRHELPYLLHAFEQGGQLGLGPENARFHVQEVAFQTAPAGVWKPLFSDEGTTALPEIMEWHIPPAPSSVVLEWLTPWRFKYLQRLLKPQNYQPAVLLQGLLHRACELRGERPSRDLLEQARATGLRGEARLEWQDWSRYSSRQKTRMQVGGLMGRIVLEGDELAHWWPLLWAGQWLHLGKFTSMGLGRYRLSAAGLPDLT